MNLLKRIKINMTNKKLASWERKLADAKTAYDGERKKMKLHEEYYNGTRMVQANPNTGRMVTKQATNVRRVVYELIESQVDASIPMPKVRAIHAEDDELALKIQRLLENMITQCKLLVLNDGMERTVPVLGGDFFHVQWDPNAGRHCEVGAVKISEVDPHKLVPQPGVTKIEDMDYFFVLENMTKMQVKSIYGVSVQSAQNDDTDITPPDARTNDDIVTVNTCYFKNDEGGIGCYVWCDDIELMDVEEFLARQIEKCVKCNTPMQEGKCPECGGKKSKKGPEDYEELIDGLEVQFDLTGQKIHVDPFEDAQEPMLDDTGAPMVDEFGEPVMQVKKIRKKVPYYRPKAYPIILRPNITSKKTLLGTSDVSVVMDQQDAINKLGTKIMDKLLKGGSLVTLPRYKEIDKNGEDLNIVRIDTPAEMQMIQTINLQPNIANDLNTLEVNYNWARSALGITDSFQGKYDASAISGTAKQYSINQAAGRLESKRTMKKEAYAKLYEMMFKYWLAFSDQRTEITSQDADGQMVHETLDRHEFLRMDASEEFYWDDEFIFTTDPTSTLMANREAMWQQMDMKLQSGAFGPVGDPETSRTYWEAMKAWDFPNASVVLQNVERKLERLQEAQQPPMEEMPDAMPEMPY